MSSLPFRSVPGSRRLGRAALTGSAMVLTLIGATPAHADDATVHLTSVFAQPIVATRSADFTTNERFLCDPEPANQRLYGTEAPFDSTRPTDAPTGTGTDTPADPTYVPANMPSVATQQSDLQAGKSTDLCFGFTLTPNVEPAIINGDYRFNNAGGAAAPFVPATRVRDDGGNPVQGDDMKTVKVSLPPGFLGDPDGGPQCTADDFGIGNYRDQACGLNTQVGTAFVRLTAIAPGNLLTMLVAGGSANATGSNLVSGGRVFNLEHGPNELGRLGISVKPANGIAATKFVIRLQATPDGRVTTVVDNAPREIYKSTEIQGSGQPAPGATPTPMYVESLGIRAFGAAAEHKKQSGSPVVITPILSKDFAQWGTDCSTDLSAHVSIDTYNGTHSEMSSAPFRLTGCDKLPFKPSLAITTTVHKPAAPTGVDVSLDFDQTRTGDGLYSALLKDASVTMPQGLEIGAQAGSRAGGLKLCSAAQFAKDSAAAAQCPAGSVAGDVTVISPLQTLPIVGKVYLGEQSAVGELPALYLEMSPQGATAADAPRFKLVGAVSAGADGRLTTTFKDAPQLRFSSLHLSFPGGDDALFSTPRTCGTTTSTSQFTSSASPTPVSVQSSLTIPDGPDCAVPGFSPTLAMTPSDTTVGAHASTSFTISRADRSPWLSNAKISLPSGFLADLNVPTECPAAQAATGDCADSARIGTVTATAGVGGKPLTLTGRMYMSERQSGAVAGAVIVVPAKIGELDLGNVVVPARIDLRPTDAGLVLDTAIPTRFRNLALNMREVKVDLDRENFPLNPTACGPLHAAATFTGDGGESATSGSDVSYTGCAARPFSPSMSATMTGDLAPKGHPTIDVNIATRAGDSNLGGTTVMLPSNLSAALPNVQHPCATEDWNAGNCPASTKVGTVKANVSITSDTIAGDVFLVKVAGKVLPGLGMNFTGRYTQRVLGTVTTDSATRRLVTSFDSIPDLPLTKLNLHIDGGDKSPITIVPDACTADTDWAATFTGQGGQKAAAKIPVICDSPKAPMAKWSAKSGLKLTFAAPTGQSLKSVKLTLPKGFKLTRSKSLRKKNIKASAKGGSGKLKYSSTSLSFVAKGAGPKTLVITLKPKAYTVPKSLLSKGKIKKGKKVSFKTRVATSGGKVSALTNSVKTAG